MKFIWLKQKGRYQSGEDLFINKIHVGSYNWNSMMSRNEPDDYKKAHQYVGHCNLPGLSGKRVYEATPEVIKPFIERMATNWFAEINRDESIK